MFGDGAAAVLLEPMLKEWVSKDSILEPMEVAVPTWICRAGGGLQTRHYETVANKEHYAYRKGQSVFKFTQ